LKLSHLMRYMLYESEQDKVVLSEEIAYLEDFVQLQQMRLSEEYRVEVDMQVTGENYDQNTIAPMILIPYIENAFKHGISLIGESFIDIKLSLREGVLSLMVSNTVRENSEATHMDKKNSGVGLENVNKRLAMIYPGKYALDIISRKHTYHVNLELTLLWSKQ
ncbi:MAG: histidine kinase, partial [Cyclobacteriaceae bacterium]